MRLVKILLCIFIFFTGIPSYAVEYSDILPDSPFEESIELVTELGLMKGYDDENFGEMDIVTRADFISTVVPLSGIDNLGISAYSGIFYDVPADSEYAPYVVTAYNLGLVSPNESGFFYPDRPISRYEALKVLVCLLGYKAKADVSDGYPNGYLKIASDLDICFSLEDSYVTRGELAWYISEVIHTRILDGYYVGDRGEFYEGGTLLSEYLNIGYVKGRMTANTAADLVGDKNSSNSFISVEFKDYRIESDKYDNLLGYDVECYYNLDDESVICVLPGDNNLLSVKSDSVISSDNGVFSYYDGNKTRRVSIPGNIYVIYNGYPYELYPENIFEIDKGSVTFIDNNKDSGYDVAVINEYENYIFQSVDIENEKLYVKGASPLQFNKEYRIVDYTNGEKKTFEELPSNNLICVLKNSQGKVVAVYTGCRSVTGVLKSIGDKSIEIDNREYKAYASLLTELKNNVGSTISVFLDCNEFAAVKDDSTSLQNGVYGYILAVDPGKGINKDVKLYVFTENNSRQIYSIPKYVKIDGEKVEKADVIKTLEDAALAVGLPDGASQLIRFKVNDDDQISYIDTSYVGAKEDKSTLSFSKTVTERTRYRNTGIFQGEFAISPDVKVFIVPKSTDLRRTDDPFYEDLFNVSNRYFFVTDQFYPQTGVHSRLEAYNFTDANASDMIVLYAEDGGDTSTSVSNYKGNVMVVENIGHAITPEGSETFYIKGLTKAGKVRYLLTESLNKGNKNWTEELAAGDVISYSLLNSKISGIKVLLYYKSDASYFSTESYFAVDSTYYGEITANDGSFIKLQCANDGSQELVFSLSDVICYDTTEKRAYMSNQRELFDKINYGTASRKAFVYCNYGSTTFIVVYK